MKTKLKSFSRIKAKIYRRIKNGRRKSLSAYKLWNAIDAAYDKPVENSGSDFLAMALKSPFVTAKGKRAIRKKIRLKTHDVILTVKDSKAALEVMRKIKGRCRKHHLKHWFALDPGAPNVAIAIRFFYP